ncbi:Rv2175c family DNA-binding protein [Actinotignum timonense]|uniref:Rv2175c family DNA-binding protein n=1 Tax=Actinotignum TaxID=1653174 RepID=UPI00254DAB81|nr:Rv2175c family DNA-binding protein [Actinotignum timonense]MDK6906269.1 Rv2175c family DNA-binding protein [Actinotignum timonense]
MTWLSLPELADYLETDLRTVRSQLRDARFLAVRRGENNALYADAGQFVVKEGRRVPLPSLRGTIISLRDAGYNDDEAQEWLRRFEPELRNTPLDALITGHTHAVRRVIAGLAF